MFWEVDGAPAAWNLGEIWNVGVWETGEYEEGRCGEGFTTPRSQFNVLLLVEAYTKESIGQISLVAIPDEEMLEIIHAGAALHGHGVIVDYSPVTENIHFHPRVEHRG